MSEIVFSFVVPTRNRAALVEKAIASILRQQVPRDAMEVLVVDNQSSDGTAERVRRLAATAPCPLRLVEAPDNRGPARSRNLGALLSAGKYIAFVDSDVELAQSWLGCVLQNFEADPTIGMVAGKLVFASNPGVVHCFGGELSSLGLGWDAHQGERAELVQQGRFGLWAPSAAMAVRRTAFVEMGGFDESFFYGYEDSDLGWRMNIAGWRCYFDPDAVALHATTDQIDDRVKKLSEELVFHYSKNRLRSMIKNAAGAGLLWWVSAALVYSFADAILRSPRKSRWRALAWNASHLRETLRLRRQMQKLRRVPESEVRRLFASTLFPPQPIRRRLRETKEVSARAAAICMQSHSAPPANEEIAP